MIDAALRSQLRWRCRRGMLELDLLLQTFFDAHFDQLTADEQTVFKHLLSIEDQYLWYYFIDAKQADDAALQALIDKIKRAVNYHA